MFRNVLIRRRLRIRIKWHNVASDSLRGYTDGVCCYGVFQTTDEVLVRDQRIEGRLYRVRAKPTRLSTGNSQHGYTVDGLILLVSVKS